MKKITVNLKDLREFDWISAGGDGDRLRVQRYGAALHVRQSREIKKESVEFDGKFEIPEGATEVSFDADALRRSWDEPSGPDEWEGPSPKEIFDALNDDPEREFDPDPYRSTSFEIDGVDVRLETRCMNDRRFGSGTRYGQPRRLRVEAVNLNAGGYEMQGNRYAANVKRRGMKDVFKRTEWESELRHKFEELREFAFDRDQVQDARRREQKRREDRLSARREAFSEADGDAERETYFGTNVPEKLSLDLSKIDPRDLPDLLDLIDVTVRELEAANEWNEKVSE